MITPSVDASTRDILRKLGCRLRDVEPWDISTDTEILAHARFTNVWTKLRAMELFEYDRVVLIDSDMLVMQNMDELMDLTLAPGTIAAGMACTCNPNGIPTYPSDWVPDNCGFQLPHPPRPEELERPTHHLLNSGLVVMEPSAEQAKALHTYVHMHPERVSAYRFPDQDLLADVYRGKYTPLPWYYNALKTIRRCHENIWDDGQVRNIHYILEYVGCSPDVPQKTLASRPPRPTRGRRRSPPPALVGSVPITGVRPGRCGAHPGRLGYYDRSSRERVLCHAYLTTTHRHLLGYLYDMNKRWSSMTDKAS